MKIAVAASDRTLSDRIARVIPGAETAWNPDLDGALDLFEHETFEVLLVTGETLEKEADEGAHLLEVISTECPMTQVVVLVEAEEVETATSALKAGARHYGRLPMRDDELRLSIEAAYATRPEFGINHLSNDARSAGFSEIIGESPAMQEVYRQVRLAGAIDVPVLIEGETGTGKDLVAREIHRKSERQDGPFVAVNLGATPSDLVGSELFGHSRGAFTGAVESRAGKFEEAQEGTVFLDEVGTIDERVQISLLRLLEESRFTRLGGKRSIRNDARVIAATNQPLSGLVEAGRFREDLFYRLDVFRIRMPPLRDRAGDVRILAEAFISRFSHQFGRDVRAIEDEVWPLLERRAWPGNVRELKNVARRAVLSCNGRRLKAAHLPTRVHQEPTTGVSSRIEIEVGATLAEVEKQVIIHTLASVGQNRTEAARRLGISRRALYNKMARHGI